MSKTRLLAFQSLNRPFLFDADDGAGGGSDDLSDKIISQVERIINSKDSQREVMTLFQDNYKLREKNRTLSERIKELEKSLPQDGTVVLSPEQAKDWDAFQALGKKPEEVKTALEEKDALQSKISTLDRDQQIFKAAKALGWNDKVLGTMLSANADAVLELDEKDGTIVPFVKLGDKRESLDEYAKSKWTEFMPALSQGEGTGDGKKFVSSGGGNNKQEKTDLVATAVESFQKQREEASQAFSTLGNPSASNKT